MSMVANFLDGYLAGVATNSSLKLEEFLLLAVSLRDYARSLDDGIYHAIDAYLKSHPWLGESEKELLCKLMYCQKLSIDVSTGATQNEMLPLRMTMQVLFFEQLQLCTYITGWFVLSDSLGGSTVGADGSTTMLNEVRDRVSRLEKKCDDIKNEIRKLVKTRGRWINFYNDAYSKVKAMKETAGQRTSWTAWTEDFVFHQNNVCWLQW